MQTEIFRRSDINLTNWRTQPYSTWTFQNVSEFVPSAVIRSARKPEAPALTLGGLADLVVKDVSGKPVTLPEFLTGSDSDALVVMRGSEVVAEWHADHCDPAKPHLIFSISKSVTGLIAGILIGRGQLSPDALVSHYLPEAAGSAYGDVTVRDLFNMNVSIDFEEAYLDENGAFNRYRRAMLWHPERPEDPVASLRAFLCTIPKAAHAHGTVHAYRSPNADMAALVLEQASGKRFADLVSTLLWQPMGAHSDAFVTVDRAGNPRSSGGMSVTARDLARLGDLVRLGGKDVLPSAFVKELWAGGNRDIWAKGDQRLLYPGGSYLYYWYETGTGALAGMGIHGQSVWIDPRSETVIVRQSSETQPVNDQLDQAVIAMLKAVSAKV